MDIFKNLMWFNFSSDGWDLLHPIPDFRHIFNSFCLIIIINK